MEQGDDVDEMWMFPLLDKVHSFDFHLSLSEHHSDDQLVQQYIHHQQLTLHPPNGVEDRAEGEGRGCGRRLRERKAVVVKKKEIMVPKEEKGSRRKIRASPYHNYQKHLIKAIKQVLVPPEVTSLSSNITLIQAKLWEAFLSSARESKKALYFIFNEQNEYALGAEEVREFGFEEIYLSFSTEQICLARSLMSELALEQLSSERIDLYLSSTRIRHPARFKSYMQLFLEELQRGYIKKRLSKHRVTRTHAAGDLQSLSN